MTQSKWTIFEFWFSRNSKSSVWNTNFFPRQAIPKIVLVLLFNYTGDTPYQVWFILYNFLAQSKITIFKFLYSQNAQNSVRKTNFFPKQAIANTFFALHSTYTSDTPCQVWFDFDNSMTQSKRTLLEIWYSRNSKCSVWNTNFFS